MNAITDKTVSITLTPSGIKAVKKAHPWLYDSGIAKINKDASSGDIAVLYDNKRKFTGIGLYDTNSPIKVRVLHSGKPLTISKDWLKEKISRSIELRRELINSVDTTGYRLVSGENDKLPGVVADIYNETLVIKLDSTCWLPHLNILTDIFIQLIKPERIILRMSRSVKEFSTITDGSVIFGNKLSKRITFLENGIKFYANPVNGQKTGFFLDQRENRAKVGKLANGIDVLNIFAYTGGFSLYAAKGGAKYVASLDISKPALDECVDNFKLNDFKCKHELICGDAFAEMDKLISLKKKYGMVIVDPPSFARKQSDVQGAKSAYYKLNKLATSLIRKDGILVAASCSARVNRDEFYETVISSVKSSGRRYEIVGKTDHAKDHPIGFPEGAYLKCIYIKIA